MDAQQAEGAPAGSKSKGGKRGARGNGKTPAAAKSTRARRVQLFVVLDLRMIHPSICRARVRNLLQPVKKPSSLLEFSLNPPSLAPSFVVSGDSYSATGQMYIDILTGVLEDEDEEGVANAITVHAFNVLQSATIASECSSSSSKTSW
ncbi:uncharacterized protein PG998_000227 [Apiospora kogelbergensis]|uniref:uncharacterized protein n=1 Tax=Apiospora kogelbergensis TaxID=1337665 RepID=UPI00312ED64E